MNATLFLEKYFGHASDVEIQFVSNWIKFAEATFGGELSKESILNNKDKLPQLFLGKNNSLSRSKYFSIKKLLSCILDFLELKDDIELPSIETLSEIISSKKYFKSLQELLIEIEKASMVTMGKNYNQDTAATNLKCICILGWYGYSYAEMSSFLSSDLHRDTEHFYINKADGVIEIKGNEFAQLQSFDEACKTQGYPSGRTIYYKKTQYLFKTTPSGATPDGKVPIDTFKHTVANFNSNNPNGINISLADLKKNGIFEKVYNRGNTTSAREELSKYITDNVKLSFIIKEYNSWVEFVAEA